MKTKNKIAFSIGILLIVIVSLGFFASRSIQMIKLNTENILKDNYNSVMYSQNMLKAISIYDSDSTAAMNLFVKNMNLQKHNETEWNEKQTTRQLIHDYDSFLKVRDAGSRLKLESTINSIIKLNTDAIQRKSEKAVDSAHSILFYTILLSLVSTLIAIFMLVRFPKMFTSPIKALLQGIIEISNHNYDKRLNFGPNSEFTNVANSFNNMAKELSVFQESSMARIISTKQYLETVINAIKEPILGLSDNKDILFANSALAQILNLSADKLIDKSALDLSLSNDLLRRLIRGLEKDSASSENDSPLKIYSDNKECYYEVHYLPLSEHSGTVVLLSDVTKFKMRDDAKTNFISVISHELKTPISAILMSLKLLEDERIGNMNGEQKELAHNIQDNSDRLLSITGELLKMTQVEAGVLHLNPKVTKPIELIDYAINATRVLAEHWNCNIEVDYPEDKISKIFVDSEKIAWVITNLLSNAIHYSSENGRVVIGARQLDKKVEIFVQDFGKGIDPRYHKTIFDRYFRVPGTKVQGSGLGLSISKDFVEAHGGTIRVDSKLGEGCRFTVTFNT
ncbi:MAG TPA: ATP-binding protein [Xylanibacter oryzae]|nr:ATP-binding protein [Xylanibacter oryzae]